MKPKLNSEKVKSHLKQIDRSIAWLARQLKVDESTMYYRIENGTMRDIDKLAGVMGCDPRDLIEMVE